jgi:hypothetical protein
MAISDTTFTMNRGDSYLLPVFCVNSDGSPVDITGDKFILTVKSNPNDPDEDAIFQKIVTDHVTPTEGETQFEIDNTDTKDEDYGTYYWDIQRITAGGFIETLILGDFVLDLEITHANS